MKRKRTYAQSLKRVLDNARGFHTGERMTDDWWTRWEAGMTRAGARYAAGTQAALNRRRSIVERRRRLARVSAKAPLPKEAARRPFNRAPSRTRRR